MGTLRFYFNQSCVINEMMFVRHLVVFVIFYRVVCIVFENIISEMGSHFRLLARCVVNVFVCSICAIIHPIKDMAHRGSDRENNVMYITEYTIYPAQPLNGIYL